MTVRKEPAEPKPLPIGKLRVTRHSEQDATGKVTEFNLRIENPGSEQVGHVLHDILPRVLELFLQKAEDYSRASDGFNWANVLGDKAQFVDMSRKMGKLYSGLWEGKRLQGEQVEEIVMDLIGHCLLILEMRTRATDYRKLGLETS